jgi:hypothetical protein
MATKVQRPANGGHPVGEPTTKRRVVVSLAR